MVDGVPVCGSIASTAPGIISSPTPLTAVYYQGDQPAPVSTLIVSANIVPLGTANSISATFTLGSAGVGVGGLNFKLFDVDGEVGSRYRHEMLVVRGYLGGDFVEPTITPLGDQVVSGDTVIGITPYPPQGAGSELSVVEVSFNSPVDTLDITFSLQPVPPPMIIAGSTPGFGIYNMEFCRIDTSVDNYPNASNYRVVTCEDLRSYTSSLSPSNSVVAPNFLVSEGGEDSLVSLNKLRELLNIRRTKLYVGKATCTDTKIESYPCSVPYVWEGGEGSGGSIELGAECTGRVLNFSYSIKLHSTSTELTDVGLVLYCEPEGSLKGIEDTLSITSPKTHSLCISNSVYVECLNPCTVSLKVFSIGNSTWEYGLKDSLLEEMGVLTQSDASITLTVL